MNAQNAFCLNIMVINPTGGINEQQSGRHRIDNGTEFSGSRCKFLSKVLHTLRQDVMGGLQLLGGNHKRCKCIVKCGRRGDLFWVVGWHLLPEA